VFVDKHDKKLTTFSKGSTWKRRSCRICLLD